MVRSPHPSYLNLPKHVERKWVAMKVIEVMYQEPDRPWTMKELLLILNSGNYNKLAQYMKMLENIGVIVCVDDPRVPFKRKLFKFNKGYLK